MPAGFLFCEQPVLLIRPPFVFEPTCHVLPSRVVVRPMNGAAFFVPLVHAVETYTITFLYLRHPRRNVNVVRNKNRLPG
jgi:hypothetical protein